MSTHHILKATLILFVGLRNLLTSKTQSEEEKKVLHYNFSPAFFSPPLICVNNKKHFSADHVGRACKSAIPHGRLRFCCFATSIKSIRLYMGSTQSRTGRAKHHLQITVMADGNNLYVR
jgi:hypothetical protein